MKLKKRSNGRNVKSGLGYSNTPVNFHERGKFFLEETEIIRLLARSKNSRYELEITNPNARKPQHLGI